jgi:sigma-B regulation protein RsbU (phosphoserine phosphatase)
VSARVRFLAERDLAGSCAGEQARGRSRVVATFLRTLARNVSMRSASFGVVLLGCAATGSLAVPIGSHLGPDGAPLGFVLGTAFGGLLLWTGARLQRRVGERLDHAFARSAYDARQVLHDLADEARGAASREGLAALLDDHLAAALRPRSLAIYLESSVGALRLVSGGAPEDGPALPAELSPELPILAVLRRPGQPRSIALGGRRDAAELGPLALLAPDFLVPILGHDGRLTGLLILARRLSGDAYSREDRLLLASVASQAGIALDSLRLAERMADRLASERRADHEMGLARQVQARLLPQRAPVLATLECGACCVQARAVGGDYYDFLELGPSRVGLVLADVSGKGLAAALLMASVQASLRSRSAEDMLDSARQLQSVNQLLFRFSDSNRYATLFLGLYDDASRRLLYANCGHPPALVLRADGHVERLFPTGPVLGVFEAWECEARELQLESGDLLAIFSDGITEAVGPTGEEFGEQRLVAILRDHRSSPPAALVEIVARSVAAFSGNPQTDDQTLVVARVR